MKIDSIAPHRRRARRIQWLVLSVALLGLACSGNDNNPMEPGAPALSSLALSVMGAVQAGQPIDIKIEAVGTDGSRPYTAFSGPVTLSTDRGTVTPTEVTLSAGTAMTAITLSVADGAVGLTATTGTATGNATIQLTALSILPGAPGDPVETAIPDIAFEPRGGDYHTDHPDIPGIPISYNTMGILFELGTTVGEANAILTNLGATIAGGIPGVLGQAPGILMVRTNSTSHATMTQHLQQLETNALVKVAVEDWQEAIDEQPEDNGNNPGDWNWEVTPTGGNWGLELARMPAVWNLNKTIERNTTPSVRMGIIDNGITAHPDFPAFDDITPTQSGDHGMHVGGIMGALYDNGMGVDGVNPYAYFVAAGEDTATHLWQLGVLHQIMQRAPDTKVINISMGTDWGSGVTNPGGNAAAQSRVSARGQLCNANLTILRINGRAPLICASAGNDSNSGLGLIDAIYNSGWSNAALEWLTPEILVVENVKRDGAGPGGATRAASSNFGGHISAPGSVILSTIKGSYGYKTGTSMASPFIAGVIGYLYALDPNFTQDEIKGLLLDTAVSVGGGAADRVDAAAAVLSIDVIQGSDQILRRFVDIDDGTIDGNQRAFFGNPGVDFVDEDADGNGGPGDGRIDMSDFRRWRDWQLQAEDNPKRSLDGLTQNPKRDINGNDITEVPEDENVWPRGDFNMDGVLSRTNKSTMPGAMGDVDATDLEVLQSLFDDPHVTAGELPGLIESGDITVDASQFFSAAGVDTVVSQVFDGITEAVIHTRVHAPGDAKTIYTVDSGLTSYGVRVKGLDAQGQLVCESELIFPLAPGEDIYFKPECTSVVVEAQLPAFLEPGKAGELKVRAGLKSGSGVNYQGGFQISVLPTGSQAVPPTGVTDVNGNFSSQITLDAGTQQTTVFVTATDPGTGQSATSSVSARLAPTGGRAEVVERTASIIALAYVEGMKDEKGDASNVDHPFGDYSNGLSATASGTNPEGVIEKSEASASLAVSYEYVDTPALSRFFGNGETSAEASGGTSAHSDARSSTRLFIDVVDDDVAYEFTGTMQGATIGEANAEIYRQIPGGGWESPPVFIHKNSDFSTAGVLEPGHYRIRVYCQTNSTSDDSRFEFEFKIVSGSP